VDIGKEVSGALRLVGAKSCPGEGVGKLLLIELMKILL
jgi:hypothetical protein